MTETALTLVSPALAQLSKAVLADDLDGMRDVAAWASAMREGAKARGMGLEAENAAAEVILRAERAMGRLLIRMALDGERAPRGRNQHADASVSSLPTLMDLVGEPDAHRASAQASNWQRLARMDDDRFEQLLAEHRNKGERIAKVNFYRDDAEAARKRAAKDIRELLADDEPETSTVEAFRVAAEALIEGMTQVPDDERPLVAGLIKRLYEAYVVAQRGA